MRITFFYSVGYELISYTLINCHKDTNAPYALIMSLLINAFDVSSRSDTRGPFFEPLIVGRYPKCTKKTYLVKFLLSALI